MNEPNRHLGVIHLPPAGTSVGTFQFRLDRSADRQVQIGDFVTADTDEGVLVGPIVDMVTIGSDRDPVEAQIAADAGHPWQPQHRPVGRVATVQVFASDRLRSITPGTVRLAEAEEIRRAAGSDRIKTPVRAGLVQLPNGEYVPIDMDLHHLIGREAASIGVYGLSGQAAKTSYMGVLLKSALHAANTAGTSAAALIFNVKGEDLIHLDQPPRPGYELTDDDKAMWQAMGVPAEPFPDVTVYSPYMPSSQQLRTSRQDAQPLCWDLPMMFGALSYVFGPSLWADDKMAAFLGDFRARHLDTKNESQKITTFKALDQWFAKILHDDDPDATSNGWLNTHHPGFLRRARRMLSTLPARFAGLITPDVANPSHDVADTGWRDGQVVVVDVAGLPPDVQGVVIGRTVDRMLRAAEQGRLGVEHLAIMMDEGNTFASSSGTEQSTVRKILRRVSKEGRYAGASLWIAAQQGSTIDDLVRDNCASRALGVLADGELATGTYGRLAAGTAERIANLPPGSMALSHFAYRSPLVVKFPRPAWTTQQAATTTTTAASLDITDAAMERLSDGLTDGTVDTILAGAGDRDAAIAELAKARVPDMSKTVLTARAAPRDPFNLAGT